MCGYRLLVFLRAGVPFVLREEKPGSTGYAGRDESWAGSTNDVKSGQGGEG